MFYLRDRFLHLPADRFAFVRKALVIDKDLSKSGQGRYLFDFYETPTHLLAPRELELEFAPGELVDHITPKPALPHLETNITFRDDQTRPWEVLRRRKSGILNLAPGKGKTVLALATAVHGKQPFVAACHDLGILGQWEKEIRDKTNVSKICQMHSKARKRGNTPWQEAEVLLSTFKTLANIGWSMPVDFYNRWGTAIYDECHHTPAESFRLSLCLFDGVRLGLTATVERRDGMELLLERHAGQILYKDLSLYMEPDITFVLARANLRGDNRDVVQFYNRMLAESETWNRYISQTVARYLAEGRRILVISHIKEHVERLNRQHPGSGLITGDVKYSERHKILKAKQLTFGTFHSAREALDGPKLDTVIFTTPFHVWSAFFQGLGRAGRKEREKHKPLVVFMEPIDVFVAASILSKLKRNILAEGYTYRQEYLLRRFTMRR